MFLKFICKVFFAKNIVKTERNSRINGRSSISMLFPGHSTTFRQNRQPFSGKPGDPAGTNTAGKNDLLRGKNKVEWNCRHTQGAQQKKQKLPHKKEPPHFLSGIPYGLANGGGSRFRSILCQGRAVRPAHTPQIKNKTPPDKLGKFSFLCRWWGSNPHVLLAQGILSPPRLPFRHTGACF